MQPCAILMHPVIWLRRGGAEKRERRGGGGERDGGRERSDGEFITVFQKPFLSETIKRGKKRLHKIVPQCLNCIILK